MRNQSESHLPVALRASCVRAMVDLQFTLQAQRLDAFSERKSEGQARSFHFNSNPLHCNPIIFLMFGMLACTLCV